MISILPIHQINKVIYDNVTYHVCPIWRGDVLATCEELDSSGSSTGVVVRFFLPDLFESARLFDHDGREIYLGQEDQP